MSLPLKKRPLEDAEIETPPTKRGTTTSQDSPGTDSGAQQAPPTVYLDDQGNVRLRTSADIETFPQDFVVCSRTLARSSPVWSAMIYGPFAESEANTERQDEWIINLPEDKSQPMLVILNIIHGRFGLIPTNLPAVQFHEILVLADKYAMQKKVNPWASEWHESAQASSQGGRPYILYIAWQLGDVHLVREELWFLVLDSAIEDGKVAFLSGRNDAAYSPLQATGVLELIAPIRERLVAAMVSEWHAIIDHLARDSGCSFLGTLSNWEARVTIPYDCSSYILGRLKKDELRNLDTPLSRQAGQYQGCVRVLSNLIKGAYANTGYYYFGQPGRSQLRCKCRSPVSAMKARILEMLTKEKAKLVDAKMKSTLERNAMRVGIVFGDSAASTTKTKDQKVPGPAKP